jgi:hypothetical protein
MTGLTTVRRAPAVASETTRNLARSPQPPDLLANDAPPTGSHSYITLLSELEAGSTEDLNWPTTQRDRYERIWKDVLSADQRRFARPN